MLAILFASAFFATALAACGTVGTNSSGGGNSASEAHTHTLTEVPEVAARCEKDGNIRYWKCDGCGKLFADAEGTEEITQADTVIPAAHKPEAVPAFTAEEMFDCDAVAHYHCSVCGKNFADEACTEELQAKDIYEQKTFLLSTAQVSVAESTSRVYAVVNDNNYNLAAKETHFALRVFLGWEIGDADFAALVEEKAEEHLEFRLNLNIDTEGTLANSQWYHFKLGYGKDGAFGGFSDSDAFVHFNLLPDGGDAIEEAFVENAGVYVTLVRDGGWMSAYVEDLEGNLFLLARTNCFGDTAMARVSLGVNQGFVADGRYPATAKGGKLVIGTTEPVASQTAEENPGDIIDEPETPSVPQLSVGAPYDPGSELWGQPASYEIEDRGDGTYAVSWEDGRSTWAKVYQNVTGYTEENGTALKITFTTERKTDVYILYAQNTDGAGETALIRNDYDQGEHTVYVTLPENPSSDFVITYYLDAKEASVKAGSVIISEVAVIGEEAMVGMPYDPGEKLWGQPASYTVEEQDGKAVISWEDGRGEWQKVYQEISGYNPLCGEYIKLTFSLSRKTNVYVCYAADVNGTGETQMHRADYEAGEHTVYFAVHQGAGESFVVEYYLDAGTGSVKAGSMTVIELAFVAERPGETTIGAMYDTDTSLGLAQQYSVTVQDGGTVVSWTTSRAQWAKVWQDVSGYKAADSGKYLKITFTVEQKTKVGVYLSSGTALLGHTEYEAGTHTVYIEIPDGTPEDFILEYYLDAGLSPMTEGSITFTEVAFVAEKPAA